ncbi:MAG: lysine biosynthesis protein LysX [Planctomycetota bacterium]
MRVGFLEGRIRVEEKLLLAELARRGVAVQRIAVEREVFHLDGATPLEDWGGVDVALDRCVSHSRALAALRVLGAFGVPCVNPWRVGELCGDKLASNLALASAGVPVPEARVAFTPDAALEAIEELGYPVVLKPVVGSWGRLLARVNDRDAAEAVLEHRSTLGSYHHSVFYVQQHVDKGGLDIRSFVVGEEVICAIERRSEHWITNTARGATTAARPLDDALVETSLAAARAVGGGLIAVDLFATPDGYLVNEVNHTMEFRNSIEPTGVDIPARIVDYVLEVGAGRELPCPPALAAGVAS